MFGIGLQIKRHWRRARSPLWSIYSQNHDHRSAAFRTLAEAFCIFRLSLVIECLRIRAETLETKRQYATPVPTRKKAEIANTYKALWKQMEQEAAQEFLCG